MPDKKKSERHVVKWRSPSGKQYQVLIPKQSRTETPQDFENRVKWAQAKMSEHEIGGDYIASMAEKHKGLGRTELINAAMINIMDQEDQQRGYLKQLDAMPPGQHAKNIRSKATLDMMRISAQKKALQTYINLTTFTTPFESEEGEGLSLYMDERGIPQAPVEESDDGMVEI